MSDSQPPTPPKDALSAEIEGYLEQVTAEPPPQGLEYRAAVWAPFHRRLSWPRPVLGGVVAAALVAVLIVGATQFHRGTPSGPAGDTGSSQAATPTYGTVFATLTGGLNTTQQVDFYSLATGQALAPVSVPGNSTVVLVGPYGSNAYFGYVEPAAQNAQVELVSFTPGSMKVLHSLSESIFVSASAASDGSAYGWIQKGTQYSCSGGTPVGPNEMYLASGNSPARQVATLPNLGSNTPWQFFSWTASHVVLAQGALGCAAGIFVDQRVKDFVDLNTGTVQSTAAATGSQCLLQAVSDNGTLACATEPPAETGSSAAPPASTVVLTLISPTGAKHNVTLAQLGSARCNSMSWGDVGISPDGAYATILVDPSSCSNGGVDDGANATAFIVTTATGAVQPIAAVGGGVAYPQWVGAHSLVALGGDSVGNTATWISINGSVIRTVNLPS